MMYQRTINDFQNSFSEKERRLVFQNTPSSTPNALPNQPQNPELQKIVNNLIEKVGKDPDVAVLKAGVEEYLKHGGEDMQRLREFQSQIRGLATKAGEKMPELSRQDLKRILLLSGIFKEEDYERYAVEAAGMQKLVEKGVDVTKESIIAQIRAIDSKMGINRAKAIKNVRSQQNGRMKAARPQLETAHGALANEFRSLAAQKQALNNLLVEKFGTSYKEVRMFEEYRLDRGVVQDDSGMTGQQRVEADRALAAEQGTDAQAKQTERMKLYNTPRDGGGPMNMLFQADAIRNPGGPAMDIAQQQNAAKRQRQNPTSSPGKESAGQMYTRIHQENVQYRADLEKDIATGRPVTENTNVQRRAPREAKREQVFGEPLSGRASINSVDIDDPTRMIRIRIPKDVVRGGAEVNIDSANLSIRSARGDGRIDLEEAGIRLIASPYGDIHRFRIEFTRPGNYEVGSMGRSYAQRHPAMREVRVIETAVPPAAEKST